MALSALLSAPALGSSAAALGSSAAAPRGTDTALGSSVHDVAAGAAYGMSVGYPETDQAQLEDQSYPDSGGELTDGRFGGTAYTDPAWVGRLRQVSRTITVDLGGTKTISRLGVDYLFAPDAGVTLPGSVRFALSTDGRSYRVAGVRPGNNRGVVDERRTVQLDIRPTYARYLRITYDVATWSFVDEISAIGVDGIADGAKAPSGRIDVEEPVEGGHFLEQGTRQVGGAKDIYLAYTYDSKGTNGELGTWHPSDLRPVVAHLGTDGRPTDWMFDTVMFMAGGSELDAYPTKAGWDDLLDRMYAPGVDLDALDAVTGEVGTALDDPSHKTKVILPIPNPVPNASTPWGELDGRTLDLNPARVGNDTSTANRVAVARWYIGEATKRFRAQAAHHPHLELAGFYWMREAIPPNSLDSDVVRAVARTLHEGAMRFYWIPYFRADGFPFWKAYGFDASMMQPNFFFDTTLPPTDTARLESGARLAKWSGQGVELEGDAPMQTDAARQRQFLGYLSVFHRTGADRAINGWYWGAKDVVSDLARSSDPAARATYDKAYAYLADSR